MPLTHRQRKRLPKPKDIAMMWRALQGSIPMDVKPYQGLRESYRGVINYRIASSTNERDWTVDVYHGEYFVVTVHGYSQPCPSVPSAIGHLKRMLGLRDVHRPNTKARP
jgi:hypothetical protein